MDVFGIALAAGGDLLRDAAIDAAYELGVIDALAVPCTLDELADAIGLARGRHRLRALVDLLAAAGVLARVEGRFSPGRVPARPIVARAGWGLLADVIRRDRALDVEGGAIELRYHEHLAQVGAPAARELAGVLCALEPRASLLDLGAGAGTYTRALLDAQPTAHATVVDYAEVIALARRTLAPYGDRVRFVDGDARGTTLGEGHAIVLLANLLHLHPPDTCAELCAIAARAVAPGGAVVIKDLRVDDDRRGPYEGLAFALNMATYTGGGDVYETSQLQAWLAAAGLVDIHALPLATQPDGIVLVGYRPRGALAAFVAITGLAEPAAREAETLDAALARTATAAATTLEAPRAFRTMLAHATAELRHAGATTEAANLATHYTDVMPRMRLAQRGEALFTTPLAWSRLPRMGGILDRLFAVVAGAGVSTDAALGAATAEAFRAATPTFDALYARTHYGGFMPLLYGTPADLAYFTRRGRELGLDVLGTIDRYLAAPMLHELCHFARDRDALLPPHLDECIAGWLGVHVWPGLAYPEEDHDGAIYAAPWLSQVGQAFARAFGVDAVVRAHAGAAAWDAALPKRFVDAVTRFGWDDWRRRRTPHFLADTFDPDPWVTRALAARELPPDPEFDRVIVRDALHAMCLANTCRDGSFRTHTALPGPIEIDARACRVTTPRRGDVDRVAPRYWLPPAVGANLVAGGLDRCVVVLHAGAAIEDAVDAILAARATAVADRFELSRAACGSEDP